MDSACSSRSNRSCKGGAIVKILCLITSTGERIPVAIVSSVTEGYDLAIDWLRRHPDQLPSQWEVWNHGFNGDMVKLDDLLAAAF